MKGYRPSNEDYRPTHTQQLSCAEGGAFDRKFRAVNAETGVAELIPTTGWTLVARDRARRGVSRKARIKMRRAA